MIMRIMSATYIYAVKQVLHLGGNYGLLQKYKPAGEETCTQVNDDKKLLLFV